MNHGHLYLKSQISPGYGLRYAERRDKLLLEQLEIEARIPVVNCGILFQNLIDLGIAIPIFGKHIKLSFQKSNIQQWAKKQVKQLM
jgi:hypothetical protein